MGSLLCSVAHAIEENSRRESDVSMECSTQARSLWVSYLSNFKNYIQLENFLVRSKGKKSSKMKPSIFERELFKQFRIGIPILESVKSREVPVVNDIQELLKKLEDMVAKLNQEKNYDSISALYNLIKLYDVKKTENPNINLKQTYSEYAPSTIDEIYEGASNCVGLSQELVNRIKEDLPHLHPYLVPSTLEVKNKHKGDLNFHHTAVIIKVRYLDNKKTLNGVILLDPGWFFPRPFFISRGQRVHYKDDKGNKNWTFAFKQNNPLIIWEKSEGHERPEKQYFSVQYEIKNPDESITKPFILSRDTYYLGAFKGEGKLEAGLAINIDQKKINFINSKIKKDFYFDELELLKNEMNEEFLRHFKLTRSEMLERLQLIIKYLPELQQLRKDFLSAQNSHRNFQ